MPNALASPFPEMFYVQAKMSKANVSIDSSYELWLLIRRNPETISFNSVAFQLMEGKHFEEKAENSCKKTEQIRV